MSRTNTAHARKRAQTTTGETIQETAAEVAQREAVAVRRKEGVSKRYFKKKEAREALHGPARKPKQPREFHPVWDADTGLRLPTRERHVPAEIHPTPLLAPALLSVLAACLDLGDARNEQLFLRLAGKCLMGTGSMLPALFGGGKGSETNVRNARRAFSNPRVAIQDLREALYDACIAQLRLRKLTRVVIAFDPTALSFKRQGHKSDRTRLGDDGEGYSWNNMAVIDPVGQHFLGVMQQTLLSADGPDDARWVNYAPDVLDTEVSDGIIQQECEGSTQQQFLAQALEVDRRLPANIKFVLAADREFDDAMAERQLLETLSPRADFVIRANRQRAVEVAAAEAGFLAVTGRELPSPQHRLTPPSPDRVASYVSDIARLLPLKPLRELPLDARGRVCEEDDAVHIAQLHAAGIRILLHKRSDRALRLGLKEEAAWANLIVVRESNPPAHRAPLEWLLLTSLPIASHDQILDAVRCYVCRWRIEELFRTCKDVLHLEESKLHHARPTARLLFFMTLKAMYLDALRADAGIAAGVKLKDPQRLELRAALREAHATEEGLPGGRNGRPLDEHRRTVMIIALLAEYGTWRNRRGAHLGNYILMRGLHYFLIEVRCGKWKWLINSAETRRPGA